ncbi:transcriptional elongation factor FACT140, putative [Babesia ovis]|uniref:FACT complex subunit n=1 Tax=Babesia ovis TaxID=5869 RepID=A0A9W5TDP7_BABOV|nr:transcriptional elongation factor FACT140, putative [Babesia ovis]
MADTKRGVVINYEEVKLKLKQLSDIFDTPAFATVNLIFLCTGKSQSDASATPSELLQLWLTGFQFPETLFAFARDGTWYILTSPKKATYLEPIKQHHEKLVIFQRDAEKPDEEFVSSILAKFENPTLGVVSGTKPVGPFSDKCLEVAAAHPSVDVTFELTKMMSIRTKVDLEVQKRAAQVSCAVMKSQLINQIENILDSEEKKTHATIVGEAFNVYNDTRFLEKMQRKYNLNPNEIEVVYSNVQSGNTFNLSIGAPPNEMTLSHNPGAIIISVCSKYSELFACVTRTLLLDGTPKHKEAYSIALKTFEFALTKLKPGATFGSIYDDVHKFVENEKPEFANSLLRSVGHTMGIEFTDSNFKLVSGNDRCVVVAGMVFHVSLGFGHLDADGQEFAVWIGDTVEVTDEGTVVLTSHVSKSLENISYELEDEEEAPAETSETKTQKQPGVSSELLRDAESVILKERLRKRDRGGQHQVSEAEIKARMERQMELRKQKVASIADRVKEEGGLAGTTKQRQVVKMDKMRAFSTPNAFSRDVAPNQIYVDVVNEVIMLPVNGYHLPFSIMTVKNASCNSEDNQTYTLRINFQVPGSHTFSSKNDVNPLPDLVQENSIFVKEVLYRSADSKHIQNVFRAIKELIKQVKQRETDADANRVLAEQEKLQLKKEGRRIVLKDLMVRPNVHGARRIIGFLEAHHNGLRYVVNTRDRVDHIDITYANIQHAIFQPCERELIVLLHFHLKSPIMVGKRKSMDVQFYCEVGTQIDDLDNRRGRSYNDPDETLEEMRDREMKRRLNADFKQFVTQLQEMSNLLFDMPYRELMFTGVPSKSNVEILPTAHCLVNLVEWPPFVLTLDEIEIVSLERVQHGLRNFDMVLVNKDYSKPVRRIDLIPVEYLDILKSWLNELDMVWYEGKNNLQWTNILKTILEDVDAFVENNAFDGFLGESEGEEESLDDEDEEYEHDSEEGVEEDSDDEYGDDDESLADEDEEDDEEEYDEEEEEGLSWDEMEEFAKKEDDRHRFDDDSHRSRKRRR